MQLTSLYNSKQIITYNYHEQTSLFQGDDSQQGPSQSLLLGIFISLKTPQSNEKSEYAKPTLKGEDIQGQERNEEAAQLCSTL